MTTIKRISTGGLLLLAVIALPVFSGCDSDSGTTSLETNVTVMTRNIYLGADLFTLLDPACADVAILGCVAQLYGTVVASDIPARMDAIAAEIEAASPDLVGLQEVSTYYSQSPGDHHTASPSQATSVTFDFLQILQSALTARGLNYTVVARNMNADVEFPSTVDGVNFVDYRYLDSDVILARNGITVSNVLENNFDLSITAIIDIGGNDIAFTRGFSTLRAVKDGVSFSFANAHLEVGGAAIVAQLAQGSTLKGNLAGLASPVVVVGDFNSDPADPSDGGSVYRNFQQDYLDAWATAGSGSGFTCCQDPLIRNIPSELSNRIDVIFARGDVTATSATVVGNDVADITASGVWPSDHAGVVSTLTIRN